MSNDTTLLKSHTEHFTNDQLFTFIDLAGKSTYAAENGEAQSSEEDGFKILTYSQGDFSYTDRYTGFYRSRGMELVFHHRIIGGRIIAK